MDLNGFFSVYSACEHFNMETEKEKCRKIINKLLDTANKQLEQPKEDKQSKEDINERSNSAEKAKKG